MPVRGFFRNRYLRPVTTCALALLQINLLWLALFHRHEAFTYSTQPVSVQPGRRQLPLVVDTALLCNACQIVRQSALRPSVSPQAPRIASLVPLRLAVRRNDPRSPQRIVVFGRAPPLS